MTQCHIDLWSGYSETSFGYLEHTNLTKLCHFIVKFTFRTIAKVLSCRYSLSELLNTIFFLYTDWTWFNVWTTRLTEQNMFDSFTKLEYKHRYVGQNILERSYAFCCA